MSELRHGRVIVSIPESIALPTAAGTLSDDEVRAIPKARLGLGQACADVADSWADVPSFIVPGVTPEDLRAKGESAESIDAVVASMEVMLNKLRQGNLLLDADAWEALRKVNDQVKAQGKHNPEILRIFKRLIDFMSNRAPAAAAVAAPSTSG